MFVFEEECINQVQSNLNIILASEDLVDTWDVREDVKLYEHHKSYVCKN